MGLYLSIIFSITGVWKKSLYVYFPRLLIEYTVWKYAYMGNRNAIYHRWSRRQKERHMDLCSVQQRTCSVLFCVQTPSDYRILTQAPGNTQNHPGHRLNPTYIAEVTNAMFFGIISNDYNSEIFSVINQFPYSIWIDFRACEIWASVVFSSCLYLFELL